jgi:hypothetical protein
MSAVTTEGAPPNKAQCIHTYIWHTGFPRQVTAATVRPALRWDANGSTAGIACQEACPFLQFPFASAAPEESLQEGS